MPRDAATHDVTAAQGERVLARARLALSAASLAAVYLDPTEPQHYAAVAYALLLGYVGASVWIVFLLERRRGVSRLPLVIHAGDLLWIGAITSVSGGSMSPLFSIQAFALVAAAYRWGFLETVVTAAALSAMLVGQMLFLRFDPGPPFELNRFIVRAAFTIVGGVVLAYLAAHARQLRQQAALLARLLAEIRSEVDLTRALERCVRELAVLFGTTGVVIAVRESSTGRGVVWTSTVPAHQELLQAEISPGDPNPYFFRAPSAFTLVRRGARLIVTPAPDAWGEGAPAEPALTRSLLLQFRHALVANERVDGWSARVFAIDPRWSLRGMRGLRLLRTLMTALTPALYSIYLVSHIRQRAEADERGRLARELHDTSIQSLIGIEMELLALGRRTADSTLRRSLMTLEWRLHEEIRALRALMARLNKSREAPRAVTEQLSEELARFQVETRIRARLISPMAVMLPPRLGQEVLRLVQAALSNVRRHSTATRVDVAVGRDASGWLVVIEDDGNFDERLRTDAPRTMRERVSALGGELVVQPGAPGVRIEIRLPQGAQA